MDNITRLENLTDKQVSIFNGEIERNKKSTATAYLLLIFLGAIGAHKFYLKKPVWGVLYLIFCIIGWLTIAIGIGAFILTILGIALLVDIFKIPNQIKKHEDEIIKELLDRFEAQNMDSN